MASIAGGRIARGRLGIRPEIFRWADPLLATAATLVAIPLSFGLMALALKSLPFGTAYAVWTGIGAVGSIIVGMLVYSEPADPVRILCLTLIVAGMVGLKLNSPV
jgi:quaternary ammonium compound-resistance protein SugE